VRLANHFEEEKILNQKIMEIEQKIHTLALQAT